MNRLYRSVLNLVLLLTALTGVSLAWAETAPTGATPYPLLASIRPIALLAQELGEGLPLQVDTLLPAGVSTHDFALSPSDLARVRGARLLVWVGPAAEPYLTRLITPGGTDMRWEELSGLTLLPYRAALREETAAHPEPADGDTKPGHHNDHDRDAHHGEHQHAHDHEPGSLDPHLWWSIGNALPLARTLVQRIAAERPHWAEQLQLNLQALEQRLQQQLLQQRQRLGANPPPFLLAHDAFFYLEEDLGIQSEAALVLDPENRPGLQHLLALKQRVARQQIRCVLTGAIVPDNLIDKIDGQPPLRRVSVDELGWDYSGVRYSEWLAQTYGKLDRCLGLAGE